MQAPCICLEGGGICGGKAGKEISHKQAGCFISFSKT